MQITSVRPILKGIMVASVDVVIPKWGNFFMKQITVFDKNGSRWMSFPSEAYEKDGEKKFARRCGFEDRETDKKFQAEFFKAFDEYLKQNPLQQPQPKQNFNSQAPSNSKEEFWY